MPLPSVLDEIDRLFDELVRRPWGAAARPLVPAHLREVKDGWVVDLRVEGLRAADLKVEVHGRQLTIIGQRRNEQRQQRKGRWTQTQAEVAWYRTIPLPAEADADAVEATVEGSMLSIHIGRRKP
jgi:HSP20 family protein